MIKLRNVEVEPEEFEEMLLKYIEIVFEFDSLLAHTKLTEEGLKRFKDNPEGILECVLMCNANNPDDRKYDRFYLDCDHWDTVFNDRFMGFDYVDVNKAVSVYVINQVEEILSTNTNYSIFSLIKE